MIFSPNVSHDINSNTFHLTFCSTNAKEDHQNYPSYLQSVINKVQIAAEFKPVECKSVINIKPHNFEIFKEAIKIRREKGKLWTGIALSVFKIAAIVGLFSLPIAFIAYHSYQDIEKSYASIGRSFNVKYSYSLNGVTYRKQYPVLYTLEKYLSERNTLILYGMCLSALPLALMALTVTKLLKEDPLIAKYNKLMAKNLQSPVSYTHTILFKKN